MRVRLRSQGFISSLGLAVVGVLRTVSVSLLSRVYQAKAKLDKVQYSTLYSQLVMGHWFHRLQDFRDTKTRDK